MQTSVPAAASLRRDLTAGVVVFLVALPLCLGVALASGAPLLSGVLAGILGGLLVGLLSGSHTSVSGPAAGLTAVVAVQISTLGFSTFLLAVMIAGLFQIVLGLARAGFIAAYFPSSVIKGLLAAIGIILVLKQIPHVFGHDPDPEGEMAFHQPDHQDTFSELLALFGHVHRGAAIIGLGSVALLILWDRWKTLKYSGIPAPLVVVLLGTAIGLWFRQLGGRWVMGADHLVQVPVADDLLGFFQLLQSPNFAQWANPAVYVAAATIAAVASLETLLNLEAVDKIDPRGRVSPPSRELFAQGVGNVASGLIGGLPVTSVIVRSTVNIHAGGRTKRATIVHGALLLLCVVFLPVWLNVIPLACLAAILLVTGIKLASPALMQQMWSAGRHQFIPFALTVTAIVLTDLLIGVLIGLGVSLAFILWSNVRRPVNRVVEKHLSGEVIRIELPTQVSFLNRAALTRVLDDVPRGSRVLFDARGTDYFDPDILEMIRDFAEEIGPARGVEVSLKGFQSKYQVDDRIQYIDYTTRELRDALTPEQVLLILKDGNERFRTDRRLTRDLSRQVNATAAGQHPLAVLLSCIDSRAPVELVFDLGVGDILSVRIAGNIISPEVLGSVEYGCAVAGAKLVLVLGHTRCGAVTAAVTFAGATATVAEATGCEHLAPVIRDIQQSMEAGKQPGCAHMTSAEREAFIDAVARRNVARVVGQAVEQSRTLADLVRTGQIAVVGAMYNVVTGGIEFLTNPSECLTHSPAHR